MTATDPHAAEEDAPDAGSGLDGWSPGARPPVILGGLFVGLMLYAAFGKGFAYAGLPPLFIGEILLVALLAAAVRPWMVFPRNVAALVAAVVGAVALVQFAMDRLDPAVPLQESLRGLAPIYYCTYAFGVFALLRGYEQRVGRVTVGPIVERALTSATPWVLGAVTVLAALLLVEPSGLPVWPNSGVTMLMSKSGDIAVTLILFASLLFAPDAADRFGSRRLLLVTMWTGAALLVAFRSRGALLALVLGVVVMRPHAVRLAKAVFAVLVVVLVLYLTGISIAVRGREVSYDAIGDAVASVLGAGPEDQIGSNYLATTNWRGDWWSSIWDDVKAEHMVLHGRGWGDNLALRHGVTPALAADDERVLRLPHNVFFSIAGRAGVLTAVGFLVVPLLTVVRTFTRPPERSTRLTVQAARGAVTGAVATGLVDIFLESPQGGILFWSLIGFLWWATAPAVEPATPDADRSVGVAA